ncbi:hypothetical protein [Sporomusa aerivorans]|uniref:hypothetical protein n=1 Tax=Sporomusa aerivorans TaxID=204936 RepID=UPI00352A96F1
MAETVAQRYMDLSAFGKASANIVGRATKVNPLRMKLLAESLSTVTVPLTWSVMARINKEWGNNQTITYMDTAGSYVWNVATGVFVITDTNGNITTRTGIETIEDLEVSWGVMALVQVVLEVLDYTNYNVFLIASPEPASKTSRAESVTWWSNEYLAEGSQHAVFSRISDGKGDNNFGNVPVDCIGIEPEFSPLLLQNGGVWVATNDYSLDLVSQDTNLPSERPAQTKAGTTAKAVNYLMIAAFAQKLLSSDSAIVYEPSMLKEWIDSLPSSSRPEQLRDGYFKSLDYLMIAAFAQNLLSSDSAIVYEPSMLWQFFQWYFQSSDIVANTRRIFDLSPRW